MAFWIVGCATGSLLWTLTFHTSPGGAVVSFIVSVALYPLLKRNR